MRVCTISIQGDGLIPAEIGLGRLLNTIWNGLISKINLTDIFMSG
jgi:hypothetical protein